MSETSKQLKGLNPILDHIWNEFQKDTRNGGTERYRGWSDRREYPILFSLPRIYGVSNVVESGTCNGCSALVMAYNLPQSGKVYTYDIVDKPQVYVGTDLESKIVRTVDPLGFQRILGAIPPLEGETMFFIDGDHSKEGVEKDISTVKRLAVRGDVIVFHDTIKWKDVQPAMEEHFQGERMYTLRTENGFGVVEL